jgi:hypothetical protein
MLVKTGVGAWACWAAPPADASKTSALIILPPGPVPEIEAKFTPFEFARF